MRVKTVVVVRHGERLDYVEKDRGENWIPKTERPWDPPLTEHGLMQAKSLGLALPKILDKLGLNPDVSAVYSSPFVRCIQTATGLSSHKVRVELGLAESLNQNWYRSWALQGTNGEWGFGKERWPDVEKLDPSQLHPLSKQPVQSLLGYDVESDEKKATTRVDYNYISKSSIDTPYSFLPPNFESYKRQRRRMKDTMMLLSDNHDWNETIVLVSHGGPVTHLYESLTGNDWTTHGMSKYCCYSIYQKKEAEATSLWTPLVVNQVLYEENNPIEEQDSSKAFTWA